MAVSWLIVTTLCAMSSCIFAIETTTAMMIVPPIIIEDTHCNKSILDIIFVLDSSGSVGEYNFTVMKAFVKSIILNLDIGPDKTRIGVITFSLYPFIRIRLNDYTNQKDLLVAIDNVPYVAGVTETQSALELLVNEGFRESRYNTPHIAIVITDGKSAKPNETSTAAFQAQKQGITLFAIGIGAEINPIELGNIATDPNKEHLYLLTNFAALSEIVNKLTKETCNVTAITIPTTTHRPTQAPFNMNNISANASGECNLTVAEVVFILDSSGSLGPDNFEKIIHFVLNIINYLDIDANLTRVGVITYSNYPTVRLTLNQYHNKAQLIDAVNRIPYYPGNTETDKALDLLRMEGFKGARVNVPKIVIVITDGISTYPDLTKIAADLVKRDQITLFAIGIGDSIDVNELNYIASDPDSNFVFFVSNFSDLANIENKLAKTTCEVPTFTNVPPTPTLKPIPSTRRPTSTLAPTQQPTSPPCSAKAADVVFVVDSSGSVGPENFLKIKEFIKQTIGVFDIGPLFTRIGVIVFSTNAAIVFTLNKYNSSAPIIEAVDKIMYAQGGTDTGRALELMRMEVFLDDRPNVPKIAIVITDGYSKDSLATKQQAMLAKHDRNITIIAIGIGHGTDKGELTDIATFDTHSNKSLVYQAGDYEALQLLNSIVATVACEVTNGIPSSENTSAPTTSTHMTTHFDICYDVVANCDEYGKDICNDYHPWSMAHCKKFCGFCTDSGPSTTPPPCLNVLSNCQEYGTYICTSVSLIGWTKRNCAKYCRFCGDGPLPTELPVITELTTQSTRCQNTIGNCDQYGGKGMCVDPTYTAWAKSHCAEYCSFCSNFELMKGIQLPGNITCPDWLLPKECTLVSVDGNCCPMPLCPPGYTLTAKLPLQN